LSDTTLVAVAVHIAYKFLANGFHYVNLSQWAQPLELNKKGMLEAEWHFPAAVDYKARVMEDDYVEFRRRCEGLWEGVFKKAKRELEAPAWLKLKTAK
jgi:hypothetical protein